MSILIDDKTKVLVQGITGREGRARTQLMKEYGTNVAAGVTPGKGGQEVLGIPVFDSVKEAYDNSGGIDATALFIPAPLVKSAAIEAIEAGIKFLVIVPDRVPVHDAMEIVAYAKEKNARFIGPNTLGILSVDKAVMGMIGGKAKSAKKWFKKGFVGVSSRSGGITSAISYYIAREGIGLSTIVHVGGDSIIGSPHPEIVKLFQQDPETKLIVIFGEIGGTQEERVAELIENGSVTKPVVSYIGGKGAKEGTRFSHAGAIVEGNRGSHESKVGALKKAGAYVVEDFMDIAGTVKKVIKEKGLK